MVRYLVAAAGVLALVSGVALAEPIEGTKTVTIHKTPHGKIVSKRYMNHRGQVVTKRKHIREGFYGSSVSRSKTVTDPAAGTSVTTRTTEQQ
ncbi:MAG: hypothetical protein ACM3JG_11970 [Thiohalocapsa sp.]